MISPHSVPPAMYPLASSTPGLVSDSASLFGDPRSYGVDVFYQY